MLGSGEARRADESVGVGAATCSVVRFGAKECHAPATPFAPFAICPRHLIEAYTFVQDMVQSIGNGATASSSGAPSSPAPVESGSVVYYLRFVDRVKIGTSRSLKKRIQSIPHDEVLAVEPGDRRLERLRHQQFIADHIAGEWFHASDALLSHARMLARHGVSAGVAS